MKQQPLFQNSLFPTLAKRVEEKKQEIKKEQMGPPPVKLNQQVLDRLNNLRRKMIVHSFLYYRLDKPIVSDASFDKWAKELVNLQKNFPHEAASDKVKWAKDFENWDGTTGFHLNCMFEPWVEGACQRLLAYQEKEEKKGAGGKKK